jgi:hypothetical protein
MSLSRAQQILVKRAQREAGIEDAEYRDLVATVAGAGITSSRDPRLTNRDADTLLSLFEAIHFRGVDAGTLQPSRSPDAVFVQRGYWAAKNTRAGNSRDRWAAATAGADIERLEVALAELGCGAAYCAAIRRRVSQGRTDATVVHQYRAALKRTLHAKRQARGAEGERFSGVSRSAEAAG